MSRILSCRRAGAKRVHAFLAAQSLLVAGVVLALFTGCASNPPAKQYSFSPEVMQAVMERKNKVVQLSGDMDRDKPVLLLLHGATEDPKEMMDIAQEWTG